MPQALHGGNIAQAAREFGVSAGALLDYSANINAFAPGIAPEVWERWLGEILRYPEADADGVRQKLAAVYGVAAGNIVPTAGAIEGLYLVARLTGLEGGAPALECADMSALWIGETCLPEDKTSGVMPPHSKAVAGAPPSRFGARIGIVEPAFSDYTRAFQAAGIQPGRIALPPELWHRPIGEWADLLEPFDVVVIGNPNNPTGALRTRGELEALFSRNWQTPKTWIVDEAFMEFVAGDRSLLGVLEKYPSLLVLRSLTKSWGIPGLRLGFVATSNSTWIEQLGAMQPPWSINAIAAQWALEVLTPDAHRTLREGLDQLRQAGERFTHGLSQIAGIKAHPSACNFLLIELRDPALDSEAVYCEMGHRGILVRRCDSFFGMPKGRFIRLAVRGDVENNRVLEALASVCQELCRGQRRGAA